MEKMLTNGKGCKELLMQRMFLAIVSSIVVQFIFVSCLVLITNLSSSYTSWFHDTWTTVTSFRMWSYFGILATVTFFQGIVCSKSYLNIPPYRKSRFAKFCGMFTSHNILLSALHIVIGALLVWLHLSVKGGKYSSMTTECTITYGTCFVEEHYFLLLSGYWSGLYFFTKTSVFQVKYLKFPIIPLSKIFRFKKELCSMLPSLMADCIWPTLYYLIGYFFLGSYCRTLILGVTSYQLESEPLNTLPRLLDMSLIFHLWMYQLIFILTIDSMYLLFEIHLTEWVPFEFTQTNVFNKNDGNVTISEALSTEKIPIMQHLGYLDLVTMAQKQKERREVLFTLSQPGGHPYNWNCVIENCINFIKKFSDDLSMASVKTQEVLPPIPSSTMRTDAFQKQYVYPMRSLVSQESLLLSTAELKSKDCIDNEPFIQKFVKAKWQGFLAYLLSKPFINYIFGEMEGAKVCHILFHAQPVIWAAEAVSSLSVASLSEDFYGIALNDIPRIVNTLLGLKQAVDKLQKSNILAKKQGGDDKFIKHIFTSLRAASKRAIYRIVTNFEVHFKDLLLEPVTMEQLQNFINYRE